MIALMILVLWSAICAPSSGVYTTCMCNLNHPTCVQSHCTTDSQCQRVATITADQQIDSDDQFCISNATIESRCNSAFRSNGMIAVRYCCTQRYCNGNNTFMFEVILAYLGDEILSLLTPTTTTTATIDMISTTTTSKRGSNYPTTTNTVKTTNTVANAAGGDSNDNNALYVPLLIALFVVVFVLVQVVVVTAVLLVFCHRLK